MGRHSSHPPPLGLWVGIGSDQGWPVHEAGILLGQQVGRDTALSNPLPVPGFKKQKRKYGGELSGGLEQLISCSNTTGKNGYLAYLILAGSFSPTQWQTQLRLLPCWDNCRPLALVLAHLPNTLCSISECSQHGQAGGMPLTFAPGTRSGSDSAAAALAPVTP